jgi:hypothetical protein
LLLNVGFAVPDGPAILKGERAEFGDDHFVQGR